MDAQCLARKDLEQYGTHSCAKAWVVLRAVTYKWSHGKRSVHGDGRFKEGRVRRFIDEFEFSCDVSTTFLPLPLAQKLRPLSISVVRLDDMPVSVLNLHAASSDTGVYVLPHSRVRTNPHLLRRYPTRSRSCALSASPSTAATASRASTSPSSRIRCRRRSLASGP
jgi:hypothetical protein